MEVLTKPEETEMTTEQEEAAFLQMMGEQSLDKMGDLGKIIPDPKPKNEEVEQEVKKDDKIEQPEKVEKELEKPEEKAEVKKDEKKKGRDEVERQKHVLADFSKKQEEFKAEREKFASEKTQSEQAQKLFIQELDELRRFKREVDHSVEKGGKYAKLDPELFRSQAKKYQDEAKKALAEDDSERAKQLFAQADQELKNAEAIDAISKDFVENDQKAYTQKVQAKQLALNQLFKDYPQLSENNGQNPFYQTSDAILKGQTLKVGDKTKDFSHLASWLNSVDNPHGYHYAATLTDLILFKNTAQSEIDRLKQEKENLQKEKDELVSKMNVGGSYAHGGKGDKPISQMSAAEQLEQEKRDFEAHFGDKFTS